MSISLHNLLLDVWMRLELFLTSIIKDLILFEIPIAHLWLRNALGSTLITAIMAVHWVLVVVPEC